MTWAARILDVIQGGSAQLSPQHDLMRHDDDGIEVPELKSPAAQLRRFAAF
jgi:hypothetical protein